MADYVPGEGDIEIELLGKKHFLKPNLQACIAISSSGDKGPRVLADRCIALDFSAICFVVACGLGKVSSDVEEAVFQAGTLNLFADCVRFIHVVSNGGRPIQRAEDEDTPVDPPLNS